MPRTCGSSPSGPAIVVARSLAIRLLAPDRVPTEVDYSRYTKQAQTGLQDYSRCCPQHVMRLLAPDRVPTEVEYSRHQTGRCKRLSTKADAIVSTFFFPMISNVPGAILFWDLRLVNVKEHMAVSDIMLGITRDYWDHYVSFPGPCYH